MKKSEIEEELTQLTAMVDVITTRPKNFEELYHGRRKDRARFVELTPEANREMLMKRSINMFGFLVEELYDPVKVELEGKDILENEMETRIQQRITEKIEILFRTDPELLELPQEQKDDLERFILYKKLCDTFRLFLDYSIQDTQLLYDLEKKLDKFRTLMMLAQYNVSFFDDVFSTIKQVEQGITNFAHLKLNKVVIDRKYDLKKQIYNKYIDTDLLTIRINHDTKFNADDSEKVKELKRLVSQDTIPGAHVLLPQIGLISVKEDTTPKLAEEYQNLWQELLLIQEQLDQLDDE